VKTLVICLLTLLVAAPAWGQWEYGGYNIGYGDAYVSPKIAPDGTGGFFIVWDGYHNGRTTKDIILNHIDSTGVALLGPNGLLITDDTVNQGPPKIAPDGAGGCYIIWFGQGETGEYSLYAQRISSRDQPLWRSPLRIIYNSNGLEDRTGIYADSIYGLIAVCCESGYPYRQRLLAQRLNSVGQIIWDSSGVILFTYPDTTINFTIYNPKIIISNNFLYLSLILWTNGITMEDIYIQKFDASGNMPWGSVGKPVSVDRRRDGDILETTSMQIVSDGTGGAVVAWQGRSIDGTTLYADRISPQGNSLWQINGRQLFPPDYDGQLGLALFSFDSADSLFIIVELGGVTGRYQAIDPHGNLLYGNGAVLSAHSLSAATAYQDTMYLMYPSGWHFFASKKTLDTTEYWSPNPWIHGFLEYWDLLPDWVGGLYVAYSWYRDFNTNWVGVQRIYPDGHFGGDTTGIDESEPAILPESPFNLTNYPNPFNSSTLITFNVDSKSKVKLNIYDSLGRMIDTIEFGQLSVGRHSYLWDTQKAKKIIASGVYIMSLEIGSQAETKRVIILK
jgi:hypothetical protein